ncbi:Glycosyltransferase BC10 [Linum perenne]
MDEVMTTADARLGRAALKMARSAILSTQTPPSSSPPSSLLPSNLPLLSAFLAFALAQFLKLFTNWYKEKRWDSKRMVDSGGMPSSHSATVTALAMAIGLQEGTGSAAFAIAVVLACVVMYDASGIRLHAGRQAELLNQIMCEFPPEHPLSSVRPLRELLGHTPFQNADADKFSVYVHSEPGFLLNETTTDSAFFHGRQLNRSVQVVWGESTMIQAEKLLLQAALHDPANQRFVLLSDSCIPLYNFSYTYSYIMSSPKSFVDSFVDESTGRYNPDMSTTIPRSKWRKGSQWVTLVRKHADVVVNDNFVYTVFRKYCKRWKARRDLPRILRILMNELEHELERRTLTYTEWDSAPTKDWRQTWHPVTFDQPDSVTEKIKEIKGINNVHYESEHRTEWCKVANIFSTCFLFARKFSQGAAVRLLNDDAVALFDPETASLSSSA